MKVFKTVVADDHDVVRKGLIYLLSLSGRSEVVGEARDGLELLRLVERVLPDLAIIDIAMPSLNGIDAAARIRKQSPGTAIIMLSMFSDEDYVVRSINAGVKGFMLKDTVEIELSAALDAIAKGRSFFSAPVADMLAEEHMYQLKQKGLTDSYELLTGREKEVLQLIAAGNTSKDVAAILNISPLTIEKHRSNLMEKLNLHNTVELVLFAVRKKIVF
jgi:two-component system, NarL family, response regulator NreC